MNNFNYLLSSKTKKNSFLLILVSIFFALNTYYFYQINFPIVQMIGLVFFGFVIYKNSINIFRFKTILFLFSGLIVYIALVLQLNIYFIDSLATPVSFVGFLLSIFVFISVYSLEIDMKVTYRSLSLVTLFLLFFWYLQFFVFYVFDYRVDYFIDIVGYPQRTNIGVFESSFFRPASLFLEPAMYTNAMLLLFFYRLLYNDLKMDKTNFIILFTIVFTMSTYGYIVFSTLLLFVLAGKKKNIPYFIFGIFTFVTLFYLFELYNHPIILRVMNPLSDMSGQLRTIGSIFEFFDLNIFNILFGFGWGNAEINVFHGSAIHYLLYNIGLLGVLLFMSIFLLILRGNRYKFLTFIVLVLGLLNNSSVLTSFFFWFMIGFVFKLTKKQYYKNGTTL
ncbi:hypothetical protein [Aliarcobacter skirrowii]|uniref:hypothetical protein n=1 Tax=Aliarcobacter skirrowii TaxID=28200 RepID=UPI0021B3FD3F|nr:hypothetical protein [Aliarcobacter skirrowii]MCT7446760.1 hypothetical protein [Aliarcobacter skirrowii]